MKLSRSIRRIPPPSGALRRGRHRKVGFTNIKRRGPVKEELAPLIRTCVKAVNVLSDSEYSASKVVRQFSSYALTAIRSDNHGVHSLKQTASGCKRAFRHGAARSTFF